MAGRFYAAYSDFTSGEWSPDLSIARVDLAKHQRAAECLLNYIVLPQGGVTRRPGTKYVGETACSSFKSILLPMNVSATKNYVLEVGGCGTIRFYSSNARLNEADGTTAVQVATPYTASDVFALHRVPSVDIQYLLHQKYQTRKLARYSDTCFRLECVTFVPPATIEAGARPQSRNNGGAVPGRDYTNGGFVPGGLAGDGVAIRSDDYTALFAVSDCGRDIIVHSGCNAGARMGIISWDCPGRVLVNVCVPFINTNKVYAGHWRITGSPRTSVTPGAKSPVGAETTLTLGIGGWHGTVLANVSGDGAVSAKPFLPGDSDCGKYALVNGGQYEILEVTNCMTARARIHGEASAITAADTGGWSLEEALWSDRNGWPTTGTFLDGRLFLGSCHRFAASKVGDYENFGLGTLDDDGLLYALDSDELQEIKWMVVQDGLVIGTLSGQFRAVGGDDNPITPSNIHVKAHTRFGASSVPPLAVANSIIYVTRSGRKVREFTINPDTLEGFVAPDLLLLAEHLTKRSTATGSDPTIVQMAYQQEPDSRIWAVRSDGVLLSCTYLRDQNVVAWARHTTEGSFESVCVIPHPDGNRDQVWVIVNRTINGVTKRYVEYLDDAGVNYPNTNVDCAYTCDRTLSCTVIAGLSHLECKRVTMVGDGGVYADQNVVGGNVTLDLAADKVEVGLPYDAVLITVRPELRTQEGTAVTARMRWSEIVINVKDSVELQAGTEKGIDILPFRSTCDPMNCAPSLYTGEKRLKHLGWDCSKVTVKQVLPLPSTILSIAGTVELGG